MAATLTASLELFSFLREFEKFRSEPYKDQGGVWTCGYGHTLPGNKKPPKCTLAQAEEWLKEDVAEAEAGVAKIVKVPLTQQEHDALVSLVFNLGEDRLAWKLDKNNKRVPTNTISLLNKGNKKGFAEAIVDWDKVRMDGVLVPSSGLHRRRLREREMFLKGVY